MTVTILPICAIKRDHEHEKHAEHKQLIGSGISAVKVLYFTSPWIHCGTRPGHTVSRPSSAAGHVCGKGTTTPKYIQQKHTTLGKLQCSFTVAAILFLDPIHQEILVLPILPKLEVLLVSKPSLAPLSRG